jgi:hypothetical protein
VGDAEPAVLLSSEQAKHMPSSAAAGKPEAQHVENQQGLKRKVPLLAKGSS